MSSRSKSVAKAKRNAPRAQASKLGASLQRAVSKLARGAKGQSRTRSGAAYSAVHPPAGVGSAVRDGLNVGMVWQNTNTVRDKFTRRFEKVCDLPTTTTAFALIQNFYLNPGNILLFPVFSQIASTYEEYICHRLRFWYRGMEYTASGSAVTAGLIIYATNMDPDDSTFTSTSQMENYEGSISGPPFSGVFMHDVLQSRVSRGKSKNGSGLALNQYFVYSSANQEAPSGQPGKFYDLGQFQIASVGTQTASPAGELWVEHEWTMIRRKQQTPIGQNSLYAHIVEGPAGTAAASGSAFLGTTGGLVRAGSTIPTVCGKATFTLPLAGTYLVSWAFVGSVTGGATLTPGSAIAALSVMEDSTTGVVDTTDGSNNTIGMAVYNVSATGTGAANTITLSTLTSLAAGKADIFICQVSGGVTSAKPSTAQIEAAYGLLVQRMDRLERGVVVTEPDTPPDRDDIKTAEVNPMTQSVHIPASRLHEFLGLVRNAK